MRVLLSDGSGLTSRQCAWLLAATGHDVGVLVPAGFTLSRTTGAVRRRHRVPPYGREPLAWADAAALAFRGGGYDVLLPTQEQVAVLALQPGRVTTVVPPFAALRRVQDKIGAEQALVEIGAPRPEGVVLAGSAEPPTHLLPAYVKAPIGTAGGGVRYVTDRASLVGAMRALAGPGGVLVQRPVPGPLLMVQAIFAAGELVAAHANRRDRTGAGNGAIAKTSVPLDPVRPLLERLGATLGWHGALSLDVIDGPDGPIVIDINPRLVEPGNAAAAGVDLIAPMLALATGRPVLPARPGRPGVRTHQLLLAMASATGRGALLRELWSAGTRTGCYRGSREELMPARRDWRPVAAHVGFGLALLARPRLRDELAADSVAAYALTPQGWTELLAAAS